MPMKVIVCFNNVRVTVPCGEGTLPVRELISKAVHRYKRATGKGSGHLVEVTSLKTISGGGILDPDDQLKDVVDDREQLIAEFEEQDRPSQHNGGDGASASSTGTTSPDIFQLGDGNISHEHPPASTIPLFPPPRQNSTSSNNANTDVVVTPRDLSLGSNLRVRRGSEPNLNLLMEKSTCDKNQVIRGNLRPFIPRRESVRESDDPQSESSEDDKKVKVTMHGSLDRKKLSHNRFMRDALRTSLSNRPEMFCWLEAQEKVEQRNKHPIKERMGPVEGHDGKDQAKPDEPNSYLVCLHNDGGPLGIHAVPATDESGKDIGLFIQSVEPDRPVHKDGRIKPSDIIVEINGHSLKDVPFVKAQDIFRTAMGTKEICLKVLKGNSIMSDGVQMTGKDKLTSRPPPVLPKPRNHAPIKPSPLTLPTKGQNETGAPPVPAPRENSSPTPAPRDVSKKITSELTNGTKHTDNSNSIGIPATFVANSLPKSSKAITESLSPKRPPSVPASANIIKPGPPIKAPKKVPPALPVRNHNTTLSSFAADAPLNALTNTRRIGKKIVIQLKKGPLGLGFSVTSRDNPTDGNCPIYIRNILPQGAAVQDGQLRPGDRLLQVNGVEMTGKPQTEAVQLLRMLPEGSVVELVVSRQEEAEERFKVPRKLGDPPVPASERGYDDDDDDDDVSVAHDVDQPPVSPLQPSHSVEAVDRPETGSNVDRITLHIPLNETGSAGLGVSVKGKTETSGTIVKDLGIFVKTVLQGGAAYKDGRLKINDQLLEVNGMKLEGLSNTSSMEALRTAMMEDTQIPGLITLTVARRSGSASSQFHFGDSPNSSQLDIIPFTIQQHPSPVTDAGAIIHQRASSSTDPSSPHQQKFGSDKAMPSPIPSVRSSRVAALRERFSDLGTGLRNESYTKATHESFNDSSAFINIMPLSPQHILPNKPLKLHGEKENIVNTHTLPVKPPRPHSTIGFLHDPRNSQSSPSDDDAFIFSSVSSSKDESDLSPNGEQLLPFAREGFGRQSMSEKRKGHLDPRSTELYKMVKANKENKGGFLGRRVRSFHVTGGNNVSVAQSSGSVSKMSLKALAQPHDLSPQLKQSSPSQNSMMHVPHDSTYQSSHFVSESSVSTLKRASSLEDLASSAPNTHVMGSSSTSQQTREVSPTWRATRFGRARACNDSFRAAVDRSYDAIDSALMDTLEEESAESGAFILEPYHSGGSSLSSETTNEDNNSLKRRKAKEKEKKGLFKGFLRFGKGQKSNEEAIRRSRSEERSDEHLVDRRAEDSAERPLTDRWASQPFGDVDKKVFMAIPVQNPQSRGRRSSQQEQERINEEYAQLKDQHVSEQHLRSQSVDPSVGRNNKISTSSLEKTSFQYPVSSSDQKQHLHYHHGEWLDPRNFHPAAVAVGPDVTGQDFNRNRSFYDSSGLDQNGQMNLTKAALSRAEYIKQLRSLYQHRHRQRQGVYPLDDREEQYELKIKEMEERWDTLPSEFEGHLRNPNSPCFPDRPSSRQADQKLPDQYSSSNSFVNANNSSTYPRSHQHHYQQQHLNHHHATSIQSHPSSRPHSRGVPGGYESGSAYQPPPQNNHYQQYGQQYPQVHDEHSDTHFQERYSSSNSSGGSHSYRVYDSRPAHPLYTVASQAYHSTANQYTHQRGSVPYSDPSSAKV